MATSASPTRSSVRVPFDLVLVPGFVSHLDLWWTIPATTALLRRLASFSRLILFDKRGTGLSDPVPEVPTLEERMEDVHAVLDAAGSDRAALLGISEGGPMSLLFAATYPQRTASLIMYGSFARLPTPSLPERERAAQEARLNEFVNDIDRRTGARGGGIDCFAPSLAGDAARREWFALYERAAASPRMVRALLRGVLEIDAIPRPAGDRGARRWSCTAPGDARSRSSAGRYLAEHMPGARYVELPGIDHLPWVGDVDAVLDEVEEFLTGTRRATEPDRVLATVLFTDIVGSTERAAELGDRRWRELLDSHDELVRRELERYRRARGEDAPATASSRPSTGRRARDPVRVRDPRRRRARWASRFAPECTPASARRGTATSAGWRYTSAPG